jgi:ABC-type polysaccharide/polyol phosphate transport system ATPase subunit
MFLWWIEKCLCGIAQKQRCPLQTEGWKMTKMIIQAEGLVKHYGQIKALDGVSFNVEEGETFGLLGPNGAGKTTLLEFSCTRDGLKKSSHGL